jgi:8-oxo-dGTP pyrophosphatase MutT (NUDIX family)
MVSAVTAGEGETTGAATPRRRAARPRAARLRSAGCLVRVRFADGLRYLVVHPSGNYNRRAPWSIPKGLVDAGERDEDAALRETREETGIDCRIVAPLGEIHYVKSRKTVVCFLAEPLSAANPATTLVEPASWEIDRAEFVPPVEARARLHPDQRPFVDRAEDLAAPTAP